MNIIKTIKNIITIFAFLIGLIQPLRTSAMIYSKNINNISLLEAEIKRLKILYAQALDKKDDLALTELRKKIKLLRTRLTLVVFSTLAAINTT